MKLYMGKYFEILFCDWSQEFLGDCIISSDKEHGRLEKELERVCKKLFNATMFNFTCLMNDVYKDNIKLHVHFHFVPRYKNKLKLFNKVYHFSTVYDYFI